VKKKNYAAAFDLGTYTDGDMASTPADACNPELCSVNLFTSDGTISYRFSSLFVPSIFPSYSFLLGQKKAARKNQICAVLSQCNTTSQCIEVCIVYCECGAGNREAFNGVCKATNGRGAGSVQLSTGQKWSFPYWQYSMPG
jgi:hypothetical protein